MTVHCENPTCTRRAPNPQAARNVGWAWANRGNVVRWWCPRCQDEMHEERS